MYQPSLSLSDFPDGGSSSSNPISPVRGSPFSSAVETALRSGSRARNFGKQIQRLCSALPIERALLTEEQLRTLIELSLKCRARKEVDNVVERTSIVYIEQKPIVCVKQKPVDYVVSDVETALRSGSRSRNFGDKIVRLLISLPEHVSDLSEQQLSEIMALAEKCRSSKFVQKTLAHKSSEPICIRNKTYELTGSRFSVRTRPARRTKSAITPKQRCALVRAYAKKYRRERCLRDAGFNMLCVLRRRLRKTVKQITEVDHTLVLLGCSLSELKAHLEARWKPGMSWQNYGSKGWHIDHIRPCASFDMSQKEEQQRCFHYTNLQPLWAAENIAKGAKWDGQIELSFPRRGPANDIMCEGDSYVYESDGA